MQNLHLTFDCSRYCQMLGEDFAKYISKCMNFTKNHKISDSKDKYFVRFLEEMRPRYFVPEIFHPLLLIAQTLAQNRWNAEQGFVIGRNFKDR